MRRPAVPKTFKGFQAWCLAPRWCIGLMMPVDSGRRRKAGVVFDDIALVQEIYARTTPGPAPAFAPELGPCWLWTGAKSKGGYGTYALEGKTQYVHRALYRLMVGKIGEGLELDHLCRVQHCINPRHLEPVTGAENMRRVALARTHCRRGHPFIDENLNVYKKGKGVRQCRQCTLDRTEKYRLARAA